MVSDVNDIYGKSGENIHVADRLCQIKGYPFHYI